MGRGTPSIGKRHVKNMTHCPRCGKFTYTIQKKKCAACAYPAAKFRKYTGVNQKVARRKGPGTGRLRFLKTVPRKAKNGFRTGTTPKSKVRKSR